jgi:hypothetical protein
LGTRITRSSPTYFQSFEFLFQFLKVFFSLLKLGEHSLHVDCQLLGFLGVFTVTVIAGATSTSSCVLTFEEQTEINEMNI